jgi:ABC-type uncharacterized transport system involved in gliding motility auxiliary subunit
MKILQRWTDRQLQITLYVLYVTILVCILSISQRDYIRIDLTKTKQYTLSLFVQNTISHVSADLLIHAFLPLSASAHYASIAQHAQDLLLDIKQLNPTRVKLKIVDSAIDLDEVEFKKMQQQAQDLNIPIQKLVTRKGGTQSSLSVPFGISFAYLNQKTQMSYLETLAEVEYQISRCIKRVVQKDRVLRIGVAQGFGEPDILNTPLWQQLSVMGEVKAVRLDHESLIGKIDILFILGAMRPYGERSRWLIDQFLCHGGGVFIALDYRQQSKVFPKIWVPQSMGLQSLFKSYGINIDWRWVVADQEKNQLAALQRDAQGQVLYEQQPLYPKTQALSHSITQGWETLAIPMAPYVQIPQDAQPLFQSYPSAIRLQDLRSLDLTQAKQQSTATQQVMAFALERTFTSAFDEQLPAPSGVIDPSHITQGYGKARLVWFGSGRRLLSAQPKALALFLYALDWLQGEEELLAIRQRQIQVPRLHYTRHERMMIQYVMPLMPIVLCLGVMLLVRKKYRSKVTR